MPEPLLDAKQLAALLNVPVHQIYQLRYRREAPPAIRVGGALRWRREDVNQWLEQHSDPQPAA